MMSIEYIERLGREAATRARHMNLRPLQVTTPEEVRGIPNFGGWRPPGWRMVRYFFCDKGWGDDGRCMSIVRLTEIMVENPDKGYAMIDEGQFQCHVGEFVRDASVLKGRSVDFRSDGRSEDDDEPFAWKQID